MSAAEWLIASAVGTVTGILSGFGIGGGTLLILYLTMFAGVPQTEAQGINLLYFLCAGIPAAYMHAKSGSIKLRNPLYAAAAGCVTSAAAAMLAVKLDIDAVRRLFGVLLLFAAANEFMPHRRETKDNQDNSEE